MHEITAIAISHVGNVRTKNEDNFFLNGKTFSTDIKEEEAFDVSNGGIYAVYDGMGGESNGELAALIATNSLGEFYDTIITRTSSTDNLSQKNEIDEIINQYVDKANAKICTAIKENGGRMGSTFAVLCVQNGTAHAYNIGDSRIYLLRNNKFTQLSQDHTHVRRLIDMGIITEEQAKTHIERNKLTQHLGTFSHEIEIEPFISEPVQIKDNDVFLLCSDGLTDMLEDSEISTILLQYPDIASIAKNLINTALQNGGSDNITVLIAKAKKDKKI